MTLTKIRPAALLLALTLGAGVGMVTTSSTTKTDVTPVACETFTDLSASASEWDALFADGWFSVTTDQREALYSPTCVATP